MAYLSRNEESKASLWKWVQEEWSWLSKTYGTDIMTLSQLPKYLAASFIGRGAAGTLNDYLTFFNSCKEKSFIDRSIKQGAESIQIAEQWVEADREALNKYLNQN